MTHAALREHAPDFFDHFTAFFTFLNAAPAPMPMEAVETVISEGGPALAVQRQRVASRAAVSFYTSGH